VEHPRLAALYDAWEGDRPDLETYARIAAEFGVRTVLDVGWGTGTFALMLARHGLDVIGVDPAAASLDVARAKPDAHLVRWLRGDAVSLPPAQVDLATMTGNVAQTIVEPGDWQRNLLGIRRALRPGGRLVFEIRNPAKRAWEAWTRDASMRTIEIDGTGEVQGWVEVSLRDAGFVVDEVRDSPDRPGRELLFIAPRTD
jgi:SAM-dependent methyltransferase